MRHYWRWYLAHQRWITPAVTWVTAVLCAITALLVGSWLLLSAAIVLTAGCTGMLCALVRQNRRRPRGGEDARA